MASTDDMKATAEEWALENPVLPMGRIGHVTGTRQYKQGDGVSPWNVLPYAPVRPYQVLTEETLAHRLGQEGSALRDGLGRSMADYLIAHGVGAVQDTAETAVLFTTTNITIGSVAASALMPGMDLVVVGTGRKVELRYHLVTTRHSAGAASSVGLYLVKSENGGANVDAKRWHGEGPSGPDTTTGNKSMCWAWDVDTVEGVEYTFRLGVQGSAAGTTRINPDAGALGIPSIAVARNH